MSHLLIENNFDKKFYFKYVFPKVSVKINFIVKLGSCSQFSERRSRAEAIISVYHHHHHHHPKLFKADRRQKITLCQLTLIMFMLRSINSGQFHQTHWSHGHYGHQVHQPKKNPSILINFFWLISSDTLHWSHGHQVHRQPISASNGRNELGKKI